MDESTSNAANKAFWFLTVLFGLLLVLLVAGLLFEAKKSELQQTFENRAEAGIQQIAQNLSATDAILDALVGLNQAGDEMDPYLFTPFNEKILQEHPFILSSQYLTYISAQEENQFIAEMHALGFSQFKIHNLDLTDKQEELPHYLVTSFIEPLTPRSAKFMGFEWIGSDVIEHEIETAMTENRLMLVKAPSFMQAPHHFLLFKPTYFGRTVPENTQQRREQFSGLFMLLIDWQALTVSNNKRQDKESGIEFKPVINKTGLKSRNYFRHRSSLNFDFIQQNTIQVGSQPMDIVATSTIEFDLLDNIQIVLWSFVSLALYIIFVVLARSRYLDRRERQKVQLQLFKERERAEVTLQSIADGVITIGIDNKIMFVNPVALRMCAAEPAQILNKPVDRVIHLMDLSANEVIDNPIEFFMDKTADVQARHGKDIALHVDGNLLSVDGNASALVDERGELMGHVLVLRDVSLERQLTHELVYQASHDALTGLVNRLEFENRLRDVLDIGRQENSEHALCYLDMDQFKLVNDTCGHIAGDELLKQVAGLIVAQMREDDLVARLGGDEFGVLIHACDQYRAEEIAERIRQSLNDYHFSWQGKIFDVSASIGLVMINRMSGDLSDLLSSADLACYAAKDAGRNMIHVYHAEDEEISQKFSQMKWLPRIKEALRESEFELAIQHITATKDDATPVSICEFLLRWPQADGTFISPASFIPSAERYDLMRDLDRWIISRALQFIPQIEQRVSPAGSQMYTINLSGQSVSDEGLADFIWQQIVDNHVDPRVLCFEVTETVAIANFSVASDFINKLRDRGCRFALDDFGSGLSSFGYLKRLPLDFLKIDGLFVRDMLKDPVDLAMVRTIQDVARVLNLKTIAEWVEDKEVYLALQDIGVDYAQGYYLSKPKLVIQYLSENALDNPATQYSL